MAAALGCGSEVLTDESESGTEGSGKGKGKGKGGGNGDFAGNGTASEDAGACGEQHLPLSDFAPNLLLVMDRTCSMGCHLPNGQPKWTALQKAVSNLVSTHDKDIRFGLMMTGSQTKVPITKCSPECPPADLQVKPGLGNGAAITSKLSAIPAPPPEGNRPVADYTCLASVSAASGVLNDPTRKNYVLLATDGFAPGHCDGTAPATGSPLTAPMSEATLKAVRDLASKGIKSYVLGFDDHSATTNKANLNALADEGGAPRAGATRYYAVSKESDLNAMLKEISTAVASCTFLLTNAPPAERIGVTFDGVTVPRDDTNGWDVDPGGKTLTFHGTSCKDLQSQKVKEANVRFACTPISPK